MQQPADHRDERGVARFGPLGEQRRADPGAERGAADEAGERQRARDQATLIADRGQRDHEQNDADVDQAHLSDGKGTTFSRMINGSQRRRGGQLNASANVRIEAD